MISSEPIALSVLVQGRNDSYMGNFLWRLSTCINKHADNIVRLRAGDEVELMLTDWGSTVPLSQALTLSTPARQLLKIVQVPPDIAAKFNQDSPYSWVHAVNAGARRSRGKFILFCDSDGYLPLESMQKLLEGVAKNEVGGYALNKSFFVGSRFHIPARFHSSEPTLESIDAFIRSRHGELEHDKIDTRFFAGNAAAYFWSRQIWDECRGFDERFIYWGWYDIDLFIRLASKYSGVDLEDVGIVTYHLEHYSDRDERDLQTDQPPRKWNPTNVPESFASNPASWGLIHEPLQMIDWSFQVQTQPDAASAPTPTPLDDELYFALQKVSRFIYLMMVAIRRDEAARDQLTEQFHELNQIKEELATITGDWIHRKEALSEASAKNALRELIQRGRQTMARIYKDERFASVRQQIESQR